MSPDVFAMALKAKKVTDPSLPIYNQVMRGPYREEFLLAMADEIKQLQEHGTLVGVKRSSLPPMTNVLPSMWTFRVNRLLNQAISKVQCKILC